MSLTDTLGSLAVATKGQYMTGVVSASFVRHRQTNTFLTNWQSVDVGTSFLKPAGVPGDILKARATVTGMGM